MSRTTLLAIALVTAQACGSIDDLDPHGEELRWSSSQLRAADEPMLGAMVSEPEVEILRFTWLPSFHPAVIIRVTRTGGGVTLTAKRLSGGPDSPGHVRESVEKPLSTEQWGHLQSLLSASDFWRMQTREPEKLDERGEPIVGMDGSVWVLEAQDSGRYHMVARWWHEDYPDFEMAGVCLVEWSGLPAEDFDAYFGSRRPTRRCS